MAQRKIQNSQIGTLSRTEIRSVIKAAHVAPEDGHRVVLKAGPQHTRQAFSTKEAALSFAQTIADHPKKGVMVHETLAGAKSESQD